MDCNQQFVVQEKTIIMLFSWFNAQTSVQYMTYTMTIIIVILLIYTPLPLDLHPMEPWHNYLPTKNNYLLYIFI